MPKPDPRIAELTEALAAANVARAEPWLLLAQMAEKLGAPTAEDGYWAIEIERDWDESCVVLSKDKDEPLRLKAPTIEDAIRALAARVLEAQ